MTTTISYFADAPSMILAMNNFGNTPLMYAVRNGEEGIVHQLLLGEQKVDGDQAEGLTPSLLYEKQSFSYSNNVNAQNYDGETALMTAVMVGEERIVRQLLSLTGEQQVDVNAQDTSAETALIYAAKRGEEGIVRQLLALTSEQQVDLNAKNYRGETALMCAARNSEEGIVNQLLSLTSKQQVDVNVKNNDGKSALMYAASNGEEGIVRQLLSLTGKQQVDGDQAFGLTPSFYTRSFASRIAIM